MELALNEKKENITSLELLEKINQFREQVEGKSELLHKDLLKIIRDEFEEEINEGKISPVKYKDKKGEERPMFILTFNQAKQVLVRESKKVRKLVIEYIEKLENALKNQFKLPSTYKEALTHLLKEVEENEKLKLKIEQDRPKVIFAEALEVSKTNILVGTMASILTQNNYKIGRNKLFEYFRENGYAIKKGRDKNLPTEKSKKLGLMVVKEKIEILPNGENQIRSTTLITPKGQKYFINKFLSLEVIAN